MSTIGTQSPYAAEAEIRKELDRDERLLWTGMPRQGLLLRPSDALFIPFSLIWGGFAFFWEYSVVTQKAPVYFALWGVPFVLVGLYLVVGRFFLDSAQRARSFYGVTDQRALVISGLMSRNVRSLALRNLPEISLNEERNGQGTIVLGAMLPYTSMWYGTSWPGMSSRLAPAFEMIDDARRVYRLIEDARRQAR